MVAGQPTAALARRAGGVKVAFLCGSGRRRTRRHRPGESAWRAPQDRSAPLRRGGTSTDGTHRAPPCQHFPGATASLRQASSLAPNQPDSHQQATTRLRTRRSTVVLPHGATSPSAGCPERSGLTCRGGDASRGTVTDPFTGQTTWDIYASLLRQGLNTQRRFVHAEGVTRATCQGEQT